MCLVLRCSETTKGSNLHHAHRSILVALGVLAVLVVIALSVNVNRHGVDPCRLSDGPQFACWLRSHPDVDQDVFRTTPRMITGDTGAVTPTAIAPRTAP
jgi:hypothetical protein